MNLEDRRGILIEAMPEHEHGLAAEERFEPHRTCRGGNRFRMFDEIERAKGARHKAHFAAGEEIFVEGNTAAADIEAALPLIRVFLHVEEDIIRKQRLQHLDHEEL